MMASTVLRRFHVHREEFDPLNPLHIESLKTFIKTGNWGCVQFYPDLPYVEVPATVLMKFAAHTLQIRPEQPKERVARIKAKNLHVPAPISSDKEQENKRTNVYNELKEQIKT